VRFLVVLPKHLECIATKIDAFGRILRGNDYEPSRVVAIGCSMTEFRAAQELGIPFLGISDDGGEAQFPTVVTRRRSGPFWNYSGSVGRRRLADGLA